MADQCIVCLENLEVEPPAAPAPLEPFVAAEITPASPAPKHLEQEQQQPQQPQQPEAVPAAADALALPTSNTTQPKTETHEHDNVAQIQVCGHVLHDLCLQEWTEKANSCPICRQTFHLVHVYDKVGGTHLRSRKIEDKKQVAEFDPRAFDPRAWQDEAEEEESNTNPCPVCNTADQEEILLLCDGCDAAYHTTCIGLDSVPAGAWFCMECVDALGPDVIQPVERTPQAQQALGQRYFFPRTSATMRRARQQERANEWQGAWGRIAGRIWNVLSLDLDYQDDDDDNSAVFEDYRRSQQLHEQERREHERWQQRLNIASRQGARDFARHIPPAFQGSVTPQESREERMAWGALEKARDGENRKRKSRSATAEPSEPQQEPERKLKRPRTRRVPQQQNGESSSSAAKGPMQPWASASAQSEHDSSTPLAGPSRALETAPSFLSSLLKEVEMSTASDEESVRSLYGPLHRDPARSRDRDRDHDVSSPGRSPSPSGYSSPRALSTTPPPNHSARPSSPQMTLSSYIAPIYPPANYSPTRSSSPTKHSRSSSPNKHLAARENQSSPENSDSETLARRNGASEVRQPRPRRTQPVMISNSKDVSPATSPLPRDVKENISTIVRTALRPHWRSAELTAVQYETINRDISRKIYEEVRDSTHIGEDIKQTWEKIANQEVARAVAGLKA
ncbi:hypothetical protein B0H63DRAFT_68326 [Podospora didyma]|uniref:PHD and RING finger domain-containing protein n=1 Tax=Podospora didyma TaxID=330526 RepID=A0AAE0K271_9PEZI|nr:hypothetical protein B0H63DRAFT_68326 [Podospora didyma]